MGGPAHLEIVREHSHLSAVPDSDPQMPEPILTNSQAAAILGVAPATLKQWRWRGEGPKFYKIMGRVGYRASDLEAFIQACAS